VPVYSYQAVGVDQQRVSGEIEAESLAQAVQQIEAQGLTILSIQPNHDNSQPSSSKWAAPLGERTDLYGRMDLAIERGKPLADALQIAGRELLGKEDKKIRKIVDAIRLPAKAEVFAGQSEVAEALPLLLSRADEASDSVADEQKQIVRLIRSIANQRRIRWHSLIYPLFLLLGAVLFLGFFCVTVVPTFKQMFTEFELRLPPVTRWLFWLSDQLIQRPWTSLGACAVALGIGGLLILWAIRLSPFLQGTWLCGGLLAGSKSNLVSMTRFVNALAELIQFGAPVHEALRVAGSASQNYRLRAISETLARDAQTIPAPWTESRVVHNFPTTLIYALHAGPNGTPCVPLLKQIVENFESRVEHRIETMSSLIGPGVIVLVGVIVGFVVIALFMPLISLMTSLGAY
jgi:type IV pilus assembly protein PilC